MRRDRLCPRGDQIPTVTDGDSPIRRDSDRFDRVGRPDRRRHQEFGSLRAVDDVTIPITDGEFLTILGPSGAGRRRSCT